MAFPIKGRAGVEPKWLLACDFDGTLYQGMVPKAQALLKTFEHHFPGQFNAREKTLILKSFFEHGGLPTETILNGTAAKLGVNISGKLKEITATQLANEKELVKASGKFFPDVDELGELEKLGIAVGITTSGEHDLVTHLVRREKKEGLFSFYFGRHYGREKKGLQFAKGVPHLEFIKKLLHGRDLPRIAYYGDTPADLDTARKMNAEIIFMRQGTLSSKRILESAREKGMEEKVIVVKNNHEVIRAMRHLA